MKDQTPWNQDIVERYRASVERGEHDDECEYDTRGFYLCHCSKRRREASGNVKPPDEDLYFPPPLCPRCGRDVNSDGDSWDCVSCRLQWDYSGYACSAEFTDDYGPNLKDDVAGWRARLETVAASVGEDRDDE